MIFQQNNSFAEDAVEYVMVYIDPVVLIYYLIAISIFVFATYNKPELRMFIITFSCIVLSVLMMMVEAYDAEAFFIFISGISSVFSILYYRVKTNAKISRVN